MPRKPRGWNVWVERNGKSWRCRWEGKYGVGQDVFIRKPMAEEAKRKKKENFQRMDAGLELLPDPLPFRTIGAFAVEYLEYSRKEKSAKTHRNFDVPAVASIRKHFGDDMPLTGVKPNDFQAWKHSLPQDTPPQRTTAGMTIQAGATFFNYAKKQGYLTRSPAFGTKKPRGGPGGRELTNEEIIALLGEGAPEPLYRAGVFSLNTYLRIEEVTLMDWRWVFEIPGYGRFGRFPRELRKNAEDSEKDCVFPINEEASRVMGPPRPSGRVFPWSAWTIQHELIRRRRAKQLPDDITFHCLRHTGATRYLAAGGHMEDLLEESGAGLWKDPRSLLKYIHVRPETLAARFAAVKYPSLPPKYKKARRSVKGTAGL